MNNHPFADPSLAKRCRNERRFRRLLMLSLVFTLGFIVFFMFDMVSRAAPAFKHAYIEVEVTYEPPADLIMSRRMMKVISRDRLSP